MLKWLDSLKTKMQGWGKANVNIDMIFLEFEKFNCQAGMQSKCKKPLKNPSHFSVNNITNTSATPGRTGELYLL